MDVRDARFTPSPKSAGERMRHGSTVDWGGVHGLWRFRSTGRFPGRPPVAPERAKDRPSRCGWQSAGGGVAIDGGGVPSEGTVAQRPRNRVEWMA